MNASRILLQRNVWNRGFSPTNKRRFVANDPFLPFAALTAASLAYCCLSNKNVDGNELRTTYTGNSLNPLLSSLVWIRDDRVTNCHEDAAVSVGSDCPSGYSESKRFYQVLAYHRELLADYQRRWPEADEGKNPQGRKRDWPRRIPKPHQVASLEFDLKFCERSQTEDTKKCQDLQFRIACFYIYQESNPIFQKRGLNLVKDLANKGHADGMCLYGTYVRAK